MALEKVDLENLKSNFEPAKFHKSKIYPNIWNTTDKDELWTELQTEFNGLLSFYKQAYKKEKHVIVSIF